VLVSQWQATIAVLGVIVWWLSPPSSLGDLALRESLRRHMTSSSTRMLSDRDVLPFTSKALTGVPPNSNVDADAGAPGDEGKSAAPVDRPEKDTFAGQHNEGWWRAKIADARSALDRDELLAEALQTRINSLTNDAASRDDPGQRAVLNEQRLRVAAELNRLKMAIEADREAIETIIEAARKQGVPPGWVRGVPMAKSTSS
jgi:hypothetical protein